MTTNKRLLDFGLLEQWAVNNATDFDGQWLGHYVSVSKLLDAANNGTFDASPPPAPSLAAQNRERNTQPAEVNAPVDDGLMPFLKKLIKEADEGNPFCSVGHFVEHCIPGVREAIANAESTRPTSQWIPVSERLPEHYQPIIAFIDVEAADHPHNIQTAKLVGRVYGKEPLMQKVCFGYAVIENDENGPFLSGIKIVASPNGAFWVGKSDCITYWMPLPLPPAPTQPGKEGE